EAVVQGFEEKKEEYRRKVPGYEDCGLDSDFCCHDGFEVKFIEAVYINNKLNSTLTSKERLEIIARAAGLSAAIKKGMAVQAKDEDSRVRREDHLTDFLCPLNAAGKCVLYEYRPLRCRSCGIPVDVSSYGLIEDMLLGVSKNMFFALSGTFADENVLIFPFYDVVSGRFVQTYFYSLLKA
ncbi:MAG: hypothetical protein ACP5J5_08415, partial [Dissulfurimicrobium sp.]